MNSCTQYYIKYKNFKSFRRYVAIILFGHPKSSSYLAEGCKSNKDGTSRRSLGSLPRALPSVRYCFIINHRSPRFLAVLYNGKRPLSLINVFVFTDPISLPFVCSNVGPRCDSPRQTFFASRFHGCAKISH